jgi:hypothetical protein
MGRSSARFCALPGLLVAVAAGLLASCTGTNAKPTMLPAGLVSPFTGYVSAQYRDPTKWLCLPGRADTCARDLTATEIRADGSRAILRQARATNAPVDCFYVYPTIDSRIFVAENHDGFSDQDQIAFATSAQAALFGQVCSLYVPLYRQATIGNYLRSEGQRERAFAVAYSDIADAFLHYMANHNRGRKIVLLGHSQGAEMVKRLLVQFFDGDAAMRARLLLAMPIGGELDVPIGRTKGGSFQNLPVCTAEVETGCIVAYRSRGETSDKPSGQEVARGRRAICVNPGNLTEDGGRGSLQAFFPRYDLLDGLEGVTTPYVFYPELYTARCVDGPSGTRVLDIGEIDEPGGLRTRPFDLSNWRFSTSRGTHMADFQFAQGDLIDMVRRRSRSE